MPDDQQPYTICPYCKKRVEPAEEGVVYAVEQVDMPGFGQPHDFIDGRAAFFHAGCPPERIGYARRPRPDASPA